MNIERSIKCVNERLSDQIEQDGINIQSQEKEENGQNEILGNIGWKFHSHEELLDIVRGFFLMQGYAIPIKNSKKDRYVTIDCDRGGCYRNKWHVPMEHRQRQMATRLINCLFEIQSKRQSDGFWVLKVKNSSHNHELSSDMSGYPSCRRLSKEEVLSIEEMTRSGIPPHQILSSLRQRNLKLQAVLRTIYNMTAKLHKDNLAGRTMIQALFEELRQGDFTFNVAHNQDGHLTHLFFAHPFSIMLTRSYSNMEKKTMFGLYKMFSKLLGPIGHPSVSVSDRELALMNAIQVVFPTTTNLLCVWHIEKNILANCKSYFEAQEDWSTFLCTWRQVINSQDEATYEEVWKFFELLYKEKKELSFKERFVNAWTEKFAHFGNRVSSRVEGAHGKLKKYLQVSTGDLHRVKNKICLAIENEYKEIKAQLSSERIQIPHKCNAHFFKDLITNVSTFSMGELLRQYEMVTNGTMQPTCTGHFMASMGLSCAHKMMNWKEDKYQEWPIIQKEDAQERISQLVNPSLPLLLEPNVQPHRGRPSGTKKGKESSSTRRNASKFEFVGLTRKCSTCKGVGHNSRTCQAKTEGREINSNHVVNLNDDQSNMDVVNLNTMSTTIDCFWLN
ncbi:hypothetical protein ACSBR1_007225 [Camellia fascicularis]